MKKLLMVALAALPALASAQNLLTDPSFEGAAFAFSPGVLWGPLPTGAYGAWSVTNAVGAPAFTVATPSSAPTSLINTTFTQAPGGGIFGAANGGSKAVYFVDDSGVESISQTLALGAGAYNFGLDIFATANGFVQPFNALFSISLGATMLNGTIGGVGSPAVSTWTTLAGVTPMLAAGNYTFSFVFTPGEFTTKDMVIDRAFVTLVPEPGTYGLMLAGLLAVGYVARRRSNKR